MNKNELKITVKNPVIDSLTYVLPWVSAADAHTVQLKYFKSQLKQAFESGQCFPIHFGMSRYNHNFRIPLSNGQAAIVQAGGLNSNDGIRVSLNPSKVKTDDIKRLNDCLAFLIGPAFEQMIRKPRLNRIDVAVDIYGIELDDLLVSYKFNQRLTIVQKLLDRNARTESIYFGSLASDYKAIAYDKVQEEVEGRLARLIKFEKAGEPATESLRLNLIRQVKQLQSDFKVVRIEVRGTKLGGIPLGALEKLENRFSRFQISDLQVDGRELSKHSRQLFWSLCQQKGVKGAFKALPADLRKEAEIYWHVRLAPWWKPEPMWRQACKALREIGLFPLEAFDLVFDTRKL